MEKEDEKELRTFLSQEEEERRRELEEKDVDWQESKLKEKSRYVRKRKTTLGEQGIQNEGRRKGKRRRMDYGTLAEDWGEQL